MCKPLNMIKQNIFLLSLYFVILNFSISSASNLDSINYFNGFSKNVFYKSQNYNAFGSRFEIEQTIILKKIQFSVFNSSGSHGSLFIHIYGYEGGMPVPKLENDIIEPHHIIIDTVKNNVIKIELEKEISASQFFVVIDSLSPGLYLTSDAEEKLPTCEAKDWDKYYYQVMRKSNGQWTYGKFGFDMQITFEKKSKDNKSLFNEILTKELGIHDKLINNRSLALFFLNDDKLVDILVDGKVYQNEGNFKFKNVTGDLKIEGSPILNCIIDINNDGFEDILFLGSRDSSEIKNNDYNKLYLNLGSQNFKEIQLDLPQITNPVSFSIGDINNDKYPDLIITQSLNTDTVLAMSPMIFINNRNNGLIFKDNSSLNLANSNEFSTIELIDYNNDNKQDIFIMNKFDHHKLLTNFGESGFKDDYIKAFQINKYDKIKQYDLYKNNRNVSYVADWVDIDYDGDLDLIETSSYLINEKVKTKTFTEIYENSGYPDYIFNKRNQDDFEFKEENTGCKWCDLNNDGLADFIILSGCNCVDPDIYLQKKDKSFSKIFFNSGLNKDALGSDLLLIDLNNDGYQDVISVNDSKVNIFENQIRNNNNYIDILAGNSDEYTYDSKVDLYLSGGRQITKTFSTGKGLLVEEPLKIHVGLGDITKIDSIRITNTTNSKQIIFNDIPINQNFTLDTKGSGKEEENSIEVVVIPNPFTNQFQVVYDLKNSHNVVLSIFNSLGNKIEEILNENQTSGKYNITWKSQDSNGNELSPGVYYLFADFDGVLKMIKLIKL